MHDQHKARKLLTLASECALKASSFQRSLAICFENPIEPGVPSSSSAIKEVAACGLPNDSLEIIRQQLLSTAPVAGDWYLESLRKGKCYYMPAQNGNGFPRLMAPSTRCFIVPGGWSHGDRFVVPFWQGHHIIGQIILDDPETGLPPSQATIQRLEEISSIATVALRDACALQELNQEHEMLRFFANCAMTGLLVVQGQRVKYVNDQLVSILGYDREHLLALNPWWNFVHPDDRPSVWSEDVLSQGSKTRIRAIRKDGRVLWLTSSIHSVLYGEDTATAYQFYDVTDRVEAEELLKEKALRDPLTGFRNRGYFDDAIQMELQRSRRYRRSFTLIMADLANFKQVNDQMGHQEGDRILSGIAGTIQQVLRDSDWVVRYGGDEFLLVLPETGSSLDGLIARLTQSVDEWCSLNCNGVPVGIDFGWDTWTPENPKPIPDLVRTADVMLYEHKANRNANQKRSVSASADSGGSETR